MARPVRCSGTQEADTSAQIPSTVIISIRVDGTLPPSPSGMEDVWQRVGQILTHQRLLLASDQSIQEQQRGMVRDGCFLMPSPWPDRSEDVCNRSWCHEYQFFYEFASDSAFRYFWVSGQLDRGYALDTIWFPDRHIALTNYLPSAEAGLFDRFGAMLASTSPKPVWEVPPNTVPRVAVTGFQQFMHVLWNQLPALDQLAQGVLPDAFRLAVICEPFGPTELLFPELASIIDRVRNEDPVEQNTRNGLVLGLGCWTITRSTQDRVRRVCASQAGPEVAERRDRFKALHNPLIWISVKPPKRTMSDQEETIGDLITTLKATYPSAGFILNGASVPWDALRNTNYPPWFQTLSHNAITNSNTIIQGVLGRIRPSLHEDVVVLNAISACEEVVWGEIATFYICHGGTMQNKIGWLHQVPGYIHSNRTFLREYRLMLPPVVPAPACYFAQDHIIIDDDARNYTALELARKDQNYRFTSVTALVESVTNAIDATASPYLPRN